MRSTSCIAAALLLALAPVVTAATGGAAAKRAGRGVTLVDPVEIVSPESVPPALAKRIAALADIDPDHLAGGDPDTQTLSMFGREDLIAAVSRDFRPTHCFSLPGSVPVLDVIANGARRTSIVIVNESHERSDHRGFTARIARRLRPLGYDTLAMETLSNWSPSTPARYLPAFATRPDLPYFEDGDGFYLSEAGFGRLGREAKALGYRLLAYEPIPDVAFLAMTSDRQIATREERQAHTLAAYLRAHPGTKLLVHVGYSHAAEVTRPDGAQWMAARLKQETGIDPLTVSQTTCRGGGDTVKLAALPTDQPVGTFDLIVDHPVARFVRGRPEWRRSAGDEVVSIPRTLRPKAGWRVIEARPVSEPVASVPIDRVAIRPGEDVALMVPPGRYRLRIIDPMSDGHSRGTAGH